MARLERAFSYDALPVIQMFRDIEIGECFIIPTTVGCSCRKVSSNQYTDDLLDGDWKELRACIPIGNVKKDVILLNEYFTDDGRVFWKVAIET